MTTRETPSDAGAVLRHAGGEELRFDDYTAVITDGKTKIYDCDGNVVLDALWDIRDDPMHAFWCGLSIGQKWGEAFGRMAVQSEIKQALGLAKGAA